MDPQSSPDLCDRFAGLCLQSMRPEELAGLRDRIMNGPPPNETFVPAALLGIAVFLLMTGSVIRPRLGIPETAYRLGVLAVLVVGIVIGGIRIGGYPAGLPEEVGFGFDIVRAYGVPAGVAVAVGFLVGAFVDDRWGTKHRDMSK